MIDQLHRSGLLKYTRVNNHCHYVERNTCLTLKKITALLKFMRDTTEKIRGHRMDMANTKFICQVQNLTLTDKGFILCAPKYA